MRIVCLSDTHDVFDDLVVPDGDLLLHGGDLSRRGKPEEVHRSAEWLRSLPHRHKVVIAGNHDFCVQTDSGRALLAGLTYLEDQGCEVEGLRIFGSPWSLAHGVWAFQRATLNWDQVPAGTDILITHSPPLGIRDRHVGGSHLGCPHLLERVRELRPRLHLFGHVHEAYGWEERDGTLFVNGSNCSLGYKTVQPAVVVDWDGLTVETLPTKEKSMPENALWEKLVRQYGAPREVRSLAERPPYETIFWVEVVSDGYGSGDVGFRPAEPGEDLLDRGSDHLHRRWAFTFGVPFDPAWVEALHPNLWERYSEVPHLPM